MIYPLAYLGNGQWKVVLTSTPSDPYQLPTGTRIGDAEINASGLTAPRTYTLPNQSGEIALVLIDVVVSSNTTIANGYRYWVNTASGAITLTLPASVATGFTFAVMDYSRTFATNNCTINGNGYKIENLADNFIFNYSGLGVIYRYIDATVGFKIIGVI